MPLRLSMEQCAVVRRYKYTQNLHYKPVFKLKKHDDTFQSHTDGDPTRTGVTGVCV